MIISDRNKYAYVSVPKCACSSAKSFLFEVENGFEFRPFELNFNTYDIHAIARSIVFEKLPKERIKDYARMTIVREPVARILSCYKNKILLDEAFTSPKEWQKVKDLRLDPKPPFHVFVDRLEDYRAASLMVEHHSRPLRYFLGTNPDYFDGIFDISETPAFEQFVKKHTGTTASMPVHNKSTNDVKPKDIADTASKKIKALYQEDYDLFGKWFRAA